MSFIVLYGIGILLLYIKQLYTRLPYTALIEEHYYFSVQTLVKVKYIYMHLFVERGGGRVVWWTLYLKVFQKY